MVAEEPSTRYESSDPLLDGGEGGYAGEHVLEYVCTEDVGGFGLKTTRRERKIGNRKKV